MNSYYIDESMVARERPIPKILLVAGVCWVVINTLQTKSMAMSRAIRSTIPSQINDSHVACCDLDPALDISSGRSIVEQAYQDTYKVFEDCAENEPFWMCLQDIQQNLTKASLTTDFGMSDDENSTTRPPKSKPWWFHTMLRDALPKNNTPSPLFGFWHDLTFTMPNTTDSGPSTNNNNNNQKILKMCSIEKIGTKQWRKVQCKLNRPDQTNMTGQPCNIPDDELPLSYDKHNYTSVSQHTQQFVFLRDPLERFLSGFLDKCEETRTTNTHCEPLEVFHDSDSKIVDGIVENKRAFFEAYVDTMPLTWNMHFFPLSLYCDGLFRHLHEYSFVGHMGPNFYEDVHQFGQLYPYHARLNKALEEIFHLNSHLALSNDTTGTRKINVGVETAAASYVKQYYTGRTVRRVLEYMSIDYVRLGLLIPKWAQELLDDDDSSIL